MSGPEDGARELPYPLGRGCCGAPDATACHQRGLCWMEGVHPESPGFVADTTAGEAMPYMLDNSPAEFERVRTVAARRHREEAAHLVARSGGAQDDSNARRLAWFTDDELTAELRRRALAGPDDTQQDGAR